MKAIRRLFSDELPFIFYFPALMWQIIFLYTPLAILLGYSFLHYDITTQSYSFTLSHYIQIFSSVYFWVILRSTMLAIVTTFLCFIIAYPVAYFLAIKGNKRMRAIMLFSLLLPSWTSLIVQIYAWFFLLEKNGFFTRSLVALGLISPDLHLLNNYFSILVGMVSCYLPFMILPLFAVLEKMDKRYLEASADLGASRFETFRYVVFPLSLPGVYAGLLLVFIPALGEFAIPIFLGGSKYMFWGNLIVEKFLISWQWSSGGALVIVGILFTILLMSSFACCINIIAWLRRRRINSGSYEASGAHKEYWV